MEREINVKLSAVAALIGGNIAGSDVELTGICVPEFQKEGCLCFIASKNNLEYLDGVASAYVMPEGLMASVEDKNHSKPFVFVKDTRPALVMVLKALFPEKPVRHNISKNACIATTAEIGEPVNIGNNVCVDSFSRVGNNSSVGNNVSIGENVHIGDNCIIYPNVTIYDNVTIGNNVIIHAGAVIGADGFGFIPAANPVKIPQKGTVIIEDFVELGANTCIDRATIGATVIGFGTKIDNLVMVGHNTRIGKACLIASQVGFSGSIETGDAIIAGGQVGFADHIKIVGGAVFGGQAGVPNDVKEKGAYLGTPCIDIVKYAKSYALFQELPELRRRIKNLEKQSNSN